MIRRAFQNLTKREADELALAWANLGAMVELIPQRDDRWTIVATYADIPDDEVPAGERKPDPLALQNPPDADATLGQLSEKYESNGDPAAIGRDRVGGFSYGAYQIATRSGTMASFLQYLDRHFADFATVLRGAGGESAAAAGNAPFKKAWKELATSDRFLAAQHAFIRATHYEPFIKRLKSDLALDVRDRSNALRDVAWSVSVHHGPNNPVFHRALAGKKPDQLNDADIIAAVYKERSRVDVYFSKSADSVRLAVADRFEDELKDALQMLA